MLRQITRALAPLSVVSIAFGTVTSAAWSQESTGMTGVASGAQEAPLADPLASDPAVKVGVESITAEEFRDQLEWWAHDDRRGREPGTPESIECASVAAKEFARLGLKPGGDTIDGRQSFFQFFERGGKMGFIPEDTKFSVAGTDYALDTDYTIAGYPTDKLTLTDLPVVFAGYGISSRRLEYDDYKDTNCRGKAVLILNYEPQRNDAKSRWRGDKAHPDSLRSRKIRAARRAGAKMIIIVNGPLSAKADEKLKLMPTESFRSRTVPVIHVQPAVAEALLAESGTTLADLQKKIDDTDAPASMALQATVSYSGHRKLLEKARNVIAVYEGTDPKLKDQVVVIGAHYDHLGVGKFGSRARNRMGEVHNGADDNATGAVGVLELAEAFAESKAVTKRSIMFILFDAEEKGLLGAHHFVKNPTVPIGNVVAMMNMDMIGHVTDNKMSVTGVGTCKEWAEICTVAAIGSPLKWTQRQGAFGGSDHLPFLGKKIPVLMFNSGLHAYYHTPDDDAHRCNPEGAREILRGMFRMAYQMGNVPHKVQWTEVQRTTRRRLTLGVSVSSVEKGLRITNITANRPASLAGLKLDDVLVKVNNQSVRTRISLRRALRRVRAGQTITVEYLRGGKKMKTKVAFEKPKPTKPTKPVKPAKKKREI